VQGKVLLSVYTSDTKNSVENIYYIYTSKKIRNINNYEEIKYIKNIYTYFSFAIFTSNILSLKVSNTAKNNNISKQS